MENIEQTYYEHSVRNCKFYFMLMIFSTNCLNFISIIADCELCWLDLDLDIVSILWWLLRTPPGLLRTFRTPWSGRTWWGTSPAARRPTDLQEKILDIMHFHDDAENTHTVKKGHVFQCLNFRSKNNLFEYYSFFILPYVIKPTIGARYTVCTT